jgi:hypothetical protein
MFREFRKLQLQVLRGKPPGSPPALPVLVATAAPEPERDPYAEAVSIVRSSGLDPDEEEATLRRLRNCWLMLRLEKRGWMIFDK